MSRLVAVPDFGDSGSLYQHVEVAEPGEPGYPTPALPEGDPWAPAVNRAIADVEAEAEEAALEAADEWDCADSNAYQARVEAGLEPEAEL
jgi:hypothetical protein